MVGRYWLECACGAVSSTHPLRDALLEAARTAPLLELVQAELVWDLRGIRLLSGHVRYPAGDLAAFVIDHHARRRHARLAHGEGHGERHGLSLVGHDVVGNPVRLELPKRHAWERLVAGARELQEGVPRLEPTWDDEARAGRDAARTVGLEGLAQLARAGAKGAA